MGNQQGIAVRRRPRRNADPQRTPRTVAVIHNHGLAEIFTQFGGHDARHQITGTPGGEWNNQTDRTIGIVLRMAGACDPGKNQKHQACPHFQNHWFPPQLLYGQNKIQSLNSISAGWLIFYFLICRPMER